MSGKPRVIFMGSPDFSVPCLMAVSEVSEVVAVYSQPDRPVGRGLKLKPCPVKAKALEMGFEVHQPEKLTDASEIQKLSKLKPDLIVVVAFGQILKREVLDIPPKGCINVHSSLLPRWRGAAPIQWAIFGGDKETGITTMHMAEKLDAGDILLQEKTPISPKETAESLHDRLATIGGDLIKKTIRGVIAGTINPIRQDENLVTYAKKLSKEMQWLDWNISALELDRKIRALNPWPGTSVKVQGRRLKIKSALLATESNRAGELSLVGADLFLGTRDGSLILTELQWEGKKSQMSNVFINGLAGVGVKLPLMLDPIGEV